MKKVMILLALVSAVSLPVMAGEACCGARKAEKMAGTNTCAVACKAECKGVKKSACTEACKNGCVCAKLAAEKAAAEKAAK